MMSTDTNGFHSSLRTSRTKSKKFTDINPTKKSKLHIPSHRFSHSCGEMITCNSCSTSYHLRCANSPLMKDGYACEHCRTRKQEKIILPFSFDPKKNLQLNGLKKNQSLQMKFPTASLIQPSGEIKFRPTSQKSKPTTNLKRKRMDSPPPQSSANTSPNTQLEALHRLFLSCREEEFHGPTFSSKHRQKSCFLCRKSSIKQGPAIQCDYCPLIYHLDCLSSSLKSFPRGHEKWMCPNHMTPIFDRCFSRKTSHRARIYHRNSSMEDRIIIQDFTHPQHQFERNKISEIPKVITEFYSQAKSTKEIPSIQSAEEAPVPYESSNAYDPEIWDVLQAILDDIVNHQPYEFSSIIETLNPIKSPLIPTMNTLDRIDRLLEALNETKNDLEENPIPSSFSHCIDLTQFRLSHAALIHLSSQTVIYIRKHVIWFGPSSFNDICLENLPLSRPCQSLTDRHACLYYDQKRNLFELLNYSEHGTIVNDVRYGIRSSDNDDDEDLDLEKCSCSTKLSAWDGPAQIEQGTVIKIGCHEFLFYRHIVR